MDMKNLNNSKLMKSTLLVFLYVILFQPVMSQTLTIATAANFRDAMTVIVDKFEIKNPEIEIKSIFGSSGSLYHQITNKAPFDIFFSANLKYPKELYDAGLTYDEPDIYAIGQLVLWSKTLDVSIGIEVLKSKKVSRIAVANPLLAPYGKSAVECLKYNEMYELLKDKIVSAENIAQTAQFVVTGNADVGFLARSQLKMPVIEKKGSFLILPEYSYSPIEQASVVIKKQGNLILAQKFMDFMKTSEVQKIIISYGYRLEK
jgi:molybdate transport system substrate-binding protein